MSIFKYHLGTTQWGLKEWVGTFYSEDARQDQFLSQYASVFNSVEGNTTFYRIPDISTIQKWGDAVPEGFKFCFKLPRKFTHYRRLKGVYGDIMQFIERFDPIRDHVGPFHIQLDPAFSYNEFSILEDVLNKLPPEYSYALELRHPDFYDRGKKENHLLHLLRGLNINRVVFDTRKLHSAGHDDPVIKRVKQKKPNLPVRFDATASRPFIRYVGANDVLNNDAYLKEWAIIVADWIREGLHPYIFIHAPETYYAPGLARHFHKELSKLIELNPMPEWPAEKKNDQLGLF